MQGVIGGSAAGAVTVKNRGNRMAGSNLFKRIARDHAYTLTVYQNILNVAAAVRNDYKGLVSALLSQ